ncbi:hypothetical protein AVEN_161002-1 [Araneus ventricosus]|uniref:Uncharacterized protein n=1 Tax=Araneus ventricosus TaxID=182803 RepID=A0A4Y2G3H7_ARAVE|nr:hypothetical protein AVEN_161002-1 [Araneus ventricosus]
MRALPNCYQYTSRRTFDTPVEQNSRSTPAESGSSSASISFRSLGKLLSKTVDNDLSDTAASLEVCVHYPTTINVLHAANCLSDILSLVTCLTKIAVCTEPKYVGNQTSFCWYGAEAWRTGCPLRCCPRHLTTFRNDEVASLILLN